MMATSIKVQYCLVLYWGVNQMIVNYLLLPKSWQYIVCTAENSMLVVYHSGHILRATKASPRLTD